MQFEKKSRHCCAVMKENVEYVCEKHPNLFDCPDNVVFYSREYDEYGLIIHDGGSSYIRIYFCPFCGGKLSDSKR